MARRHDVSTKTEVYPVAVLPMHGRGFRLACPHLASQSGGHRGTAHAVMDTL